MNPVFFGLLLLDVLALWALILWRKIPWGIIAVAIALVFSVNFLTLNAFGSGAGWPTKGVPGGTNIFLGCDVVEPDPMTNLPGNIYLWVVPLKGQKRFIGYSSPAQAPRAFQEPYTRQLHEQCVKATKAMQNGQQTLVGRKTHKKGHHGRASAYAQKGGQFHFYHLPPTYFPRKIGNG